MAASERAFFQVFGQEHGFAESGRSVGRTAECQIASESQPRVVARAMVNHVAEGRRGVLPVGVEYFAVGIPFDEGGQAGGAVVEEEVVAIYAV